MGQTIERMKEGYSKIRNEALAHAFAYMNLIEHWGSGIPRIIGKVKAAGLQEPEFIGGEVDLTESKKHENYRFVKESDISILEKEDMQFVPDALDTMRKAFDLRRKIKESH